MVLDLDPREIRVVYVDVHQGRRLSRRIAQGEARADSYHHVGGLHYIIELVHLLSLATRAETGAIRQWMAVRNGPLATAGRNHWYACRLGQLDEGLFRIGARDSAAGVYQGRTRSGDDLSGLPKVFRAGHNSGDTGGTPQRDLLPLHSGLGRHLDQNGTGTACTHLPERLEHGIWYFPRSECLPLPLGHGAHRARLVRDLMNGPQVLADCAARDLAGNEEHGRGARVRVSQAGSGIVETRARNHERYPRFSSRACIAVGHVCRGLLMPGRDHADARLVPKRGDDPVDLDARDSEDDLDAFSDE